MYPIRNMGARAYEAGFTAVESMIALVVVAILLAVGIPNMSAWLTSSKAAGAAQFYAEGLALARSQALAYNAESRLVLSRNQINGQPDWQVDVCFPTSVLQCDEDSERWSTTDAAAVTDGPVAANVLSVRRSSASLPDTGVLSVSGDPEQARAVYFTPLGWVNVQRANALTRIDLAPAAGREGTFPSAAVALTLAGAVTRCSPDAGEGDSRRCPE